jgi:hypothetical protein
MFPFPRKFPGKWKLWFLLQFWNFSQNLGYLWIIWVKIGRSLIDNWGKNWQLSNILFCGYRRLEIADPCRNLYSPGHSAPASKKLGGSWNGKSACL